MHIETNEEGAMICQGVVSGSLVPRLSPTSVMSSLKFAGTKVTTLLLRVWLRSLGKRLVSAIWRCENTLQKRFGMKNSGRCLELRGGHFSEVSNVLQVWDFQSVTRTLSALGSVSAQVGSTVVL